MAAVLSFCLRLVLVAVVVSVFGSSAFLYYHNAQGGQAKPCPLDIQGQGQRGVTPPQQPSPLASPHGGKIEQGVVGNAGESFNAVLAQTSAQWPGANMDRTTMLDKKFELSTQLLRKYMTKFHKSYYEKEMIRWQLSEALNQTHTFFPPRTKPVNVAILTPHEGQASAGTRNGHYTKEHYARIHGYRFILDTSPYAAAHTRHPTWNRVPSLQKHLPNYDWIFYLDSDIAIANVSILLEDFIHQFPPATYLAFTDGHKGFNAGAFFIKNVPWSHDILERWWNASSTSAAHRHCDHLLPKLTFQFGRCMFQWNDQVALWDVLLPYYHQQKGSSAAVCKTSPSFDWDKSMRCYATTMAQLGLPYQKRSGYHIHFWSLQAWPRGFTFFYLERKTLSTWAPEELYNPGDFVIHAHGDLIISELSAFHYLKWLEPRAPTRAVPTVYPSL